MTIFTNDITFTDTSPNKPVSALGKNLISSTTASAARVAISAAENLEIVDSWRDGSQVTNWARFQSTLNTIITKNRARGLTSGALTTPAGTYPGGSAYIGGVLLPDGRVFCVPNSATTATITATRSHVGLDSNITLSPFFNKF